MNEIMVRIRFQLPSLPRAEKVVAEALLENPEAIANFTLSGLAHETGSSDASIKDVVPNDIKTLIQGTNIKRIYCNGGTSLKLYKKYQEKETGIKAILLPSSSPANARYRLCDLVDIWKKKLTL